jgi:hypothetical protein
LKLEETSTETTQRTFARVTAFLFLWLIITGLAGALRILPALGVFPSVIVAITCFANLIFPEYTTTLQYGWAPIAIAEMTTGVRLMLFAVKTLARSDQQFTRPAVIRS